MQVWQHIDGGSCPGQGIGVRTRLDNGITGFIHIKNLSDKQVKNVEDRVQVRCGVVRYGEVRVVWCGEEMCGEMRVVWCGVVR